MKRFHYRSLAFVLVGKNYTDRLGVSVIFFSFCPYYLSLLSSHTARAREQPPRSKTNPPPLFQTDPNVARRRANRDADFRLESRSADPLEIASTSRASSERFFLFRFVAQGFGHGCPLLCRSTPPQKKSTQSVLLPNFIRRHDVIVLIKVFFYCLTGMSRRHRYVPRVRPHSSTPPATTTTG